MRKNATLALFLLVFSAAVPFTAHTSAWALHKMGNGGRTRHHHRHNSGQLFVIKCPHTNKNVAGVLWTLNGTLVFGVHFASNSTVITPFNANGSSAFGDGSPKVWKTMEGGHGLVQRLMGGRYKIEVEHRRGGRWGPFSWYALRIDPVDLDTDCGQWRCQLLVADPNGGKLRMAGESRKSIGAMNGRHLKMVHLAAEDPQAKNGVQKRNLAQWKKAAEVDPWEFGQSSPATGQHRGETSFAFSKTDTDLVVFERTDGRISHGAEIEYTRMDSEKPAQSAEVDVPSLMRWTTEFMRRNGAAERPPILANSLVSMTISSAFSCITCILVRIL